MKINAANTAIIKRLLVGRNNRPLRSILSKLENQDLASLVSHLNKRELRLFTEALISIEKVVKVLVYLPEPQLIEALRNIESSTLQKIIEQASYDDAAYILSFLTEGEQSDCLLKIEREKSVKISHYLNYPKDSCGRMMHSQVFSLPLDFTVQQSLAKLRERSQSESIYYIYCVNERNQLCGILSLRQLAIALENKKLADIIKSDVVFLNPEDPIEKAAKLVSHYDLIAIPVISQDRQLLGIITVDDILDIIQNQATADIYAQAGLKEDDRVFTPASESIKKRLPWMFLNLLLGALASSVVSMFEATMSQLIILASLKNIVAGMGGNTAIQSLTVVTRGIATGDFAFVSQSRAILKEISVGVVIGVAIGLSAGLLTWVWKDNLMVSIIICVSMILNSFLASLAGATVPVLLNKWGWDPAAGGGVLVTTFMDIISFLSFLGIASGALYYLNLN